MTLLHFQKSIFIPKPVSEVFKFICEPINSAKISPYRISAINDFIPQPIHLGQQYMFRIWLKNSFPVLWELQIIRFEKDHLFTDLQKKGFFKYFEHTHRCEPVKGGTLYFDEITYRSFFPEWVDRTLTQYEFKRLFEVRQEKMRRLLN